MITLSFSNCHESGLDTTNGSASVTITPLSSASALSGRMTMTGLAQSHPNHAMTINGSAVFDYAAQSPTADTLKVTADGAIGVAANTHVFSDTVTLQSGFVENSGYDASAVPPEGGSSGRTTMTLNGNVQSSAAGGIVAVSTSWAFVVHDVDSYPRSGVATINGSKGTMRVTAQSASQVLIDPDADGNGQYESANTATWDWLF